MVRLLTARFLILLLALPLQACGALYSAESIEAWVVDAETNQPIEGIVITANWQLKGGLEGGNDVGQLMVMETITDRNGRFYFPGWGPKLGSWEGRIKSQRPQLLLFKSGYKYVGLENATRSDYGSSSVLKSDWNGKTIKMQKIGADPQELLRNFENLNFIVESVVRDTKACDWKKIPKMLLAVRKQRTLLIEKGITGGILGIHSVDEYLISNAEKFSREGGPTCGSPKNFFESN